MAASARSTPPAHRRSTKSDLFSENVTLIVWFSGMVPIPSAAIYPHWFENPTVTGEHRYRRRRHDAVRIPRTTPEKILRICRPGRSDPALSGSTSTLLDTVSRGDGIRFAAVVVVTHRHGSNVHRDAIDLRERS